MPDVVLTPGEQTALSSLIAPSPCPDTLPERRVLKLIDRLIPCRRHRGAPTAPNRRVLDDRPPVVLARLKQQDAALVADSLHLGFRNGSGNVVDLWLDRTGNRFDDRDVAMLAMLAPLLRRLVRERPTPHTAHLTVQERRVLMLVRGGLTNAEIAAGCRWPRARCASTSSTATASSASPAGWVRSLPYRECDHPELDLRARLERFA